MKVVGKPLRQLANDPGLIPHRGCTNRSPYLPVLLGQLSLARLIIEYRIIPGLTLGHCQGCSH